MTIHIAEPERRRDKYNPLCASLKTDPNAIASLKTAVKNFYLKKSGAGLACSFDVDQRIREYNALGQQLENRKQEIATMENRLFQQNNLENQVSQLQKQKDLLTQHIDAARKTLSDLSPQISNLKYNISELQKSTGRDFAPQRTILENLKKEISSLSEQKASVEREISQIKSKDAINVAYKKGFQDGGFRMNAYHRAHGCRR